MKLFVAIAGIFILFATLWEAFETIILPRRVTRPIRLVRMFYRVTWTFWALVNRLFRSQKLREAHLSYYGPLSLLGLFATWAFLLVFAFAMLHWAAGSAINTPGEIATFRTDIYLSGTTFFTLGLGDIVPQTSAARVLSVIEAGTGFGFLALIIAYLPTLYGAFSQREINISLLDARAGSPPTASELLRRHGAERIQNGLAHYLRDWENWSGQLMETHVTYPFLCFFRSQHDNQSWVAAFTAILDTCALLIAYGEGETKWQAQLTFAICRHAVADLAQIFYIDVRVPEVNRLPPQDLPKVRRLVIDCGVAASADLELGDAKLKELRLLYEPYLNGLSKLLLMPLPPWGVDIPPHQENTVWGRITSRATSPRKAEEVDHF